MLSFTPSPDRFVVEEVPAYAPSGEGTHTFLWLEKRGLTTFDAIAQVAAAFGVAGRDIGYAGMKDKQATPRQWLSVPDLDPERALTFNAGTPEGSTKEGSPNAPAFPAGGVSVLAAVRHPHKLRLGHLRGNRFEVVLTGTASDDDV